MGHRPIFHCNDFFATVKTAQCIICQLLAKVRNMSDGGNDSLNWKTFEIVLASFQSVGKWQSSFVNRLLAFLCLVWIVDLLHQSGAVTVSVLGATVQISGFWQVVPLVTVVLCLGLIGSINLTMHSWRRLDNIASQMFPDKLFYVELDPHKNILDYLGYLTPGLRKTVLPESAANAKDDDQRWNPSLWLYPLLILFSIYTTSFTVRRVEWSRMSFTIIVMSTVAQAVFAFPFIWRKACLYAGVHKSAYEGVTWVGVD